MVGKWVLNMADPSAPAGPDATARGNASGGRPNAEGTGRHPPAPGAPTPSRGWLSLAAGCNGCTIHKHNVNRIPDLTDTHSNTQTLHHFNTLTLHHFNTLTLHHSTTLTLHHSTTLTLQHPKTLTLKHSPRNAA